MSYFMYVYCVDIARLGGRLFLDDDIRLITRGGQRSLGEEDFTDIFADGMFYIF